MAEFTTLHANAVSLGYGAKPILEQFSAEIEAGEFIAILGPNGAGKTTLLKTLLGLIPPISGNLSVLGHAPHRNCVEIGYMPQHAFRLPFSAITVQTLLEAAFPSDVWGLPHTTAAQHEQIAFCLAQVGASELALQTFATLSGGQQRRVMLAQALLGRPRLLLLDEPLANLDMRYQEAFIEVLHKICREQKLTVLMTAHDINPLLKAISRVLYLANGNARLGSVQEVLTSSVLTALYQTPIEVIRHQERLFVLHADSGHIDHAHCDHQHP
jgi:zinc/manganese transport system ATP-binding protein